MAVRPSRTDPPVPRAFAAFRLLAWGWLLAGGLGVFFLLGTYATSGNTSARLVLHVIVATIIVGFVIAVVVRPSVVVIDELSLTALAVTVVGIVAAVASTSPRQALEGAAGIAAACAVFVVLYSLIHDPWFARRIEPLAVVVPIAILAAYLIHLVGAWMEWWAIVGRITMPPLRPNLGGLWFGSPNIVASVLVLSIPQAAVRLPIAETRQRRIAVALLASATAFAVVMTGSRGGLVAAGIVGVSAVAWSIRSVTERRRWSLRGIGIALACAGIGVALFLPALVPRFMSVAGADQRLSFWEASARMIASSPITGVGPGVWPIAKLSDNPPGEPNLVVPHAHDTLIHVAAELGMLGLLAMLLVLVVVTRYFRAVGRDPGRRSVAAATAIGFGGFATTAVVDHALNLGAVFLVGAVIVAALGPLHASRRSELSPRLARLCGGIVVPLAVLVTVAVLRWDVASIQADRADRLADAGRWADARSAWLQAATIDPELPMLHLSLGLADAHTGGPDTVSELSTAVREDGLAMHLVSLARVQLATGDARAALVTARVALDRDAGDENVAINVGAIAEIAGDGPLAVEAYGRAVGLDPELAWSGYWRDPARSVSYDQVVDAAFEHISSAEPLRRSILSLFANRTSSIDVSEADASYLAAIRTLVDQGPGQALPMFRALAERDPLDARSVIWALRLSRATGDIDAASRYEAWVRVLGVDASAQAAKQGSVVQLADESSARPIPANYPWALYGRFGPRVLVVPGTLVIDPRAIPPMS